MDLISFFSGCGGLDLGFHQAGFNTILANDINKSAVNTFNCNFPSVNILDKSISKISISDFPSVTGVIGGPPCQSFSLAGAGRGVEDSRGQLFHNYLSKISEIRPTFFVAENVKGLLSNRHTQTLISLMSKFKEIGYSVELILINSENYGVAQSRERIFLIGIKKGVRTCDISFNEFSLAYLSKAVLAEVLTHKTSGENIYKGGFSPRYMSRNRKRNWTQPSFTIPATARHVPLHPSSPDMIYISKDHWIFNPDCIDLYRRFSVEECALIQSFPIEFQFKYSSLEEGYKMIGNAVPPKIAKMIAHYVRSKLML